MKIETKVGATFIIAIGILGNLILRTEKIDLLSRHSQNKVIVEFDQVAGLNIKSAMRVAGVKVGEVTNIDLINNKARVTIGIPKNFDIYRDASASLNSIGILGEKYVDLSLGHPIAGKISDGMTIKSKCGVGLDFLVENISDISKDVKNITSSLSNTIGGKHGQQRLEQIINNIYQLTNEFRMIAQENHKNINSTVSNLQQVSLDLSNELPKIAKQFNELGQNLNDIALQNKPEFNGLLVSMRKLTADLQGTSDNILSITNKINSGEGSVGKLINDESTIKKINKTVDNINSMFGEFNNTNINLDLSAASWTKRNASMAGISLDIVHSHDYWYSMAMNSTPDGKIKKSNTKINTNKNPNTISTQDSNITTIDQTFTVSAQFAKRLTENIVITAGIIENKGGGSIEYRAINDRFRLGLMGYDFNKHNDKPKPRYRITSSYQFNNTCYIQMGMQDLANSKLRTFCIGGGLRWKDENLKKLLGVASLVK